MKQLFKIMENTQSVFTIQNIWKILKISNKINFNFLFFEIVEIFLFEKSFLNDKICKRVKSEELKIKEVLNNSKFD